ncbi:MAG: carboxypeptidase regulatory-like domain-containing protein, partial [Deltaproteobacteria bacterium]|nr:carboxypeptidase regulatory-like domain-containing protein [Deltaproteobacteria bacterium]MBN2672956.1 carboxypeptidase regulatory-like domain-containing protein [Deltaproteobacteria bacterium]
YQKEDWWIDLASVIAESGVPQNTAVAAGGTAAGDSKLKSGDSAMEKKTSGLSSEKNTDGESGSSLLWILALLAVVPLLLGGVIVFIIALVKRRRASAAAPAQNSGLHSRNGQKILFAVAAALLVILAWGAVALMFAKSCGGSGESTVYGVVTDANKRPLSGVTVRAGEQEVITGQWGTFMLEKISAQTPELPVTFSKESYARSQRMVKSNVPATQLRVALISLNTDAQVTTIQNSNGGKATTPGGASVQFPAQGVASGTDDVVVKMAHFTPDHPLFGELSPGDGALSGKGNDGTDFIIDSAALIFVEMEDASGAEVKLAEGKTATLSMPAPGVVAGQAQGLFSYDFESGRWKEESGAMVVDGIATGNVSHFSVWNVGAKSGAATVTGQVIDRNGRPLAGQKVQVDKLSAVTNAQGHYQLGVPAGKALKVRMNFKGFDIDMDAGPIDAGASETIDLSVPPMTYVVGTLNDCDAAQQSGQVHLMWDETEYSTMYTADGRFEVSLPSVVKEGTFSATAAGFTVEVPFKNAQGLSEIQLGAVAVCPKQQETPDDKKAPSKAVDTGAVDTAGDTVQKKTESIDTGSASKDTSSSVETPSADTDTASVDTETAPANSGGAGGGVAGKYNFVSRSDGKRLVSYHYILLNSDGTSAEEYSPLNSNGYVSRMTGTWSVSGDTLLLHYRHGNDTYKVNGNQLVGTSDDGTSFTFVK